jgi:hypothetical protein
MLVQVVSIRQGVQEENVPKPGCALTFLSFSGIAFSLTALAAQGRAETSPSTPLVVPSRQKQGSHYLTCTANNSQLIP